MKQRQSFIARLIFIVLLGASFTVSSSIYSWVDADSKVPLTDKPTGNALKVKVKINPYESPSEIHTDGISDLTKKPVVIYPTRCCGYCKNAKAYLNSQNISYTEYDIETSVKGRRDYKKLHGNGVPIILVGKQRLDGFIKARLARMLKDSGY